MANDVRSYGALILGALEKQDAETLALLRANQELTIQTMMLNTKQLQVTEANDQITALTNQQAVTNIRYKFYLAQSQTFQNQSESTAISQQQAALTSLQSSVDANRIAAFANLAPSINVGIAGAAAHRI